MPREVRDDLYHMTRADIYQIHPDETWGIYRGDSGGAVWFPTCIDYGVGIVSREADNHDDFIYSHISHVLADLETSSYPDLRLFVEDDSWTYC